jgi:hypothetical protein
MCRRWQRIAFVTILLVSLIGCRGTDRSQSILGSLQKVDEYPLYVMHFEGSYEGFRAEDGAQGEQTGTWLPADRHWACSLFAALGDPRNSLFGRNFDWRYSPALLLYTDPPDGYASVTMVDITYLGFEGIRAQQLIDLPLQERRQLLDAPRWPFDGMNEYGLAVGMAAVPSSSVPVDPEKPTIGSLQAIREMLDHAKNVAEAIELVGGYNIDMSGGPPIHYLIADASGNAALVEFVEGAMVVVPNVRAWHVATNYLQSAAGAAVGGICDRYDKINTFLGNVNGKVSAQEAMMLLSSVAQNHTQWSVVYEMNTGDVNITMGMGGNSVHLFHLDLAAP